MFGNYCLPSTPNTTKNLLLLILHHFDSDKVIRVVHLQIALYQDVKSISKAQTCNFICKSKLELIKKLKTGMSVASVCEECGVKKQIVSDIKKTKDMVS